MKAAVKSAKVSTRKVRLVADSIRNMPAKKALATLSLIHKHGAPVLTKAIESAVSNAVNNNKASEETLIIDRLEINEGPFLKRFHASTRGRVHPYKKRTSHITVILKEANGKKG